MRLIIESLEYNKNCPFNLNEVYYGKQPIICNIAIDMAKCFAITRLGEAPIELDAYKNVCKNIASAFGFKSVSVFFGSDTEGVECYTNNMKFNNTIPENELFVKSDVGIKLKPKHRFKLAIYIGAKTIANLDDSEIMALVIHEIGTCFSQIQTIGTSRTIANLLDKATSFGKLYTFKSDRMIENADDYEDSVVEDLASIIKTNLGNRVTGGDVIRVMFSCNSISKAIRSLNLNTKNFMKKVMKFSALGLLSRVANVLTMNRDGAFNNTAFKDSFAVSHGYGAELSSAIVKLNYSAKPHSIVDQVIGLSSITAVMPISFNDLGSDRMISMVQKCKYELSRVDVPKEVRDELESTISTIEKSIKNYDLNLLRDPLIGTKIQSLINLALSKAYRIPLSKLLASTDYDYNMGINLES